MPADAKLILVIGGLHLLGLVLVAVLLAILLRSGTPYPSTPPNESDEGNGGGNDRLRPRNSDGPRDGGLPLPDAQPARVRLREPARLADLIPGPSRRPVHEPAPVRGPSRIP